MNFKPTYNRILITPVEKPRTKGGIILPEGDKNGWGYARIEAQGPDVTRTTPGNIILYYKVDAVPLEIDDVPYLHIREDHVIGIYTKEENNA
jgi:co-chaperonin GroES (HSP10)